MPKASFNPADAVATQLGIQNGNVEVVAAVCKVHQFPPNKNTKSQSDAFSCVAIQLQPLDEDMDATEAEPEWSYLSLGKDSLTKYHPGNVDNADDDEPSDEGDDVDTEGNCVNALNGDAFNKKCKWMIFSEALKKCGVKPEVLGKGFLPDLVGIKGHVKTEKMDKIEEKADAPTVLIFDKITVFPGKLGKKGKTEAPVAGKKKAPPKDEDADESADTDTGEGDESVADAILEIAKVVLAAIAKKMSEQALPIKKLKLMAQTEMIRSKVKGSQQSKALDQLCDEEWLAKQKKLVDEVDDGVVTFK